MALVALAPLTLPIPRPLALPLAGGSLIANGRARPDACSSAALATISALSASLSARVRLRTGFSTTTSFPFLFSRPISKRQKIEHLVSVERLRLRCGWRGCVGGTACESGGSERGGGAE